MSLSIVQETNELVEECVASQCASAGEGLAPKPAS